MTPAPRDTSSSVTAGHTDDEENGADANSHPSPPAAATNPFADCNGYSPQQRQPEADQPSSSATAARPNTGSDGRKYLTVSTNNHFSKKSEDGKLSPSVSVRSTERSPSSSSLYSHTNDTASHSTARTRNGSPSSESIPVEQLLTTEDEDSPFAFSVPLLQRLHDPKSTRVFHELNGLSGICHGLHVDPNYGIDSTETHFSKKVTLDEVHHAEVRNSLQDFNEKHASSNGFSSGSDDHSSVVPEDSDRVRVYGANQLPETQTKGLLRLMLEALKDKVLILLSIAAVISLALGLYQTFGQPPTIDPITGKPEPRVDWVEGVAHYCCNLDCRRRGRFANHSVEVLRNGRVMTISVFDLVVGDVVFYEAGDVVPADGVIIEAKNTVVDESAMTGESDTIKKTDGFTAFSNSSADVEFNKKADPFLISGSTVLEGGGKYIITAVGVNSFSGSTMMAVREEGQATPLQIRLSRVADTIAKLGGGASMLLFFALIIEFLVRLRNNHDSSKSKGQEFMQILIVSITLLVVAVPEGLPLAVTLALAFATNRMQKDNNLVRHLQACETMGTATNICSDKTGTLTQNKMTVVAGGFGTSVRFFNNNTDVATDDSDGNLFEEADSSSAAFRNIDGEFRALLLDSIALNTTCRQVNDDSLPAPRFVGSKTEMALLDLAVKELELVDVDKLRTDAEVIQVFSFSSNRKGSGVVYKKGDQYIFLVKGMPEKVIGRSTRIITGHSLSDEGSMDVDRDYVQKMISGYASRSLRTLGFCYRTFPSWPPKGANVFQEDGKTLAHWDSVFSEMTFLAFFGIVDPLRPDVPNAVKQCQQAGVTVRMVTGDNVLTAKAISKQCGILQEDSVCMEGPEFREMEDKKRMELIPRLHVLARSSPLDKQLLIESLQRLNNVVAVTGDGTNDAPALKKADVGFSMGQSGTEIAKEASDIILMDDNFSSIVKAIAWGRAVNDAVKKFLQFQITVNITAVFLTIISALASSDQTSVLSAVQLLWVNLIMDTLAALALATDPPTPEMLQRPPEEPNASLFTFDMWKMILSQSAFQLVITLILHFAGNSIFNYSSDSGEMNTIVFNTFVWMQLFNEVNNRRLDNKLNIFEHITHNWLFIAIFILVAAIQVVIVFFGGAAFSIHRIDGKGWLISIIAGFASIPLGVLVRCVPNSFIRRVLPIPLIDRVTHWILHPRFGERSLKLPDHLQEADMGTYEPATPSDVVEMLRESLSFVNKIRGGRIRHIFERNEDAFKNLPPGVRPSLHRRIMRLRTPSVSSMTSMALMVPFSTLVSEASGRLGDERIWTTRSESSRSD
ncbi:vacuolar calcium transporting P-type ATPase P2 type [Schizosaccharomyces japonicus yFS275]|uniref:Calcium-transporting ATPase n=1 Tax=Schizosaccharomyces japonicus (strain yFS275 / FY16936) TaxID=402676 RepID=B6JXT6_SCHJY|nr:vacuolar calcium transporting P-type ATPase P2 type [Schizosaccharomyces japonicus yFS275]EEB06354.2 vacuolar calcium transporting P-type ATPase P2 type [Schizosaccharomyces japonicus yFS275]